MLKLFDLCRAAGTCRFLVLKRGRSCRKRSRRADGQREGVAMNTRQYKYEVVPYPKLRRVLEIMYPSVKRKPMIHGLLEVDVTRARAHLRDHKAKTGESLSFTAFIITCLARAVDESKSSNGPRRSGRLRGTCPLRLIPGCGRCLLPRPRWLASHGSRHWEHEPPSPSSVRRTTVCGGRGLRRRCADPWVDPCLLA